MTEYYEGGVEPQVASESQTYKENLLNTFIESSLIATRLSMFYTMNREDYKDHVKFIAIESELWRRIRPKLVGSKIEDKYERFRPFANNTRLFLVPGFEHLIWELHTLNVEAFEHLGITNLK